MRIIGHDGKQVGIFDLETAQKIAEEENLDLILVNEKVKPIVARLVNYSYFIYQKEKKLRKSKKKAKELKEMRISFREADYDLKRKAEIIKQFLTMGHQVQIKLILKGRENIFTDLAEEKFRNFLNLVSEIISFKVSQPMKKISNFYSVVITKA